MRKKTKFKGLNLSKECEHLSLSLLIVLILLCFHDSSPTKTHDLAIKSFRLGSPFVSRDLCVIDFFLIWQQTWKFLLKFMTNIATTTVKIIMNFWSWILRCYTLKKGTLSIVLDVTLFFWDSCMIFNRNVIYFSEIRSSRWGSSQTFQQLNKELWVNLKWRQQTKLHLQFTQNVYLGQ